MKPATILGLLGPTQNKRHLLLPGGGYVCLPTTVAPSQPRTSTPTLKRPDLSTINHRISPFLALELHLFVSTRWGAHNTIEI